MSPASLLVGFALIGGLLQVFATVSLGLAGVDELAAVAVEGARFYLLGILGSSLGVLAAFLLRARPIVAGTVLVAWQALVLWPLSRVTSQLGLAYYGDFVLHHFIAFVSGCACLLVAVRWAKDKTLGPIRWPAVIVTALASTGLLFLHLGSRPGLIDAGLPQATLGIGVAAMLIAMLSGLIMARRPAANAGSLTARLWLGAALLLLPPLLRVLSAWPEGLSGGSVPDGGRFALMATVVLVAFGVFAAFRPDVSRPLRFLVIALSGAATLLLCVIYQRRFGRLEDGIGGLAQSLFGFPLPYPLYVPVWKLLAVGLAMHAMFSTVYGGLLSLRDRERGLAFGLLLIAGLGLSSPQLTLMVGAGYLLLVDTLVRPELALAGPSDRVRMVGPETPLEEIVTAVAARLGWSAPVGMPTMLALRGEVQDTAVDVRARPRGGGWSIVVRTGVLARSGPEMQLVPDATGRGSRPAHELAASHRIVGSMRVLERLGDPVLDALLPFTGATAKFHSAGTEVDLGPDLGQLDAEALTRLIQALAART